MSDFPLELISNFISLIVIGAIFYQFYEYKQKLSVIKGLNELKENNKLQDSDKNFIETNFNEYTLKLQKQEALIKFIYPIFIMTAAVFILMFDLTQALIHMNIVIVMFIYLHIVRIHIRNFVGFLQELKA